MVLIVPDVSNERSMLAVLLIVPSDSIERITEPVSAEEYSTFDSVRVCLVVSKYPDR